MKKIFTICSLFVISLSISQTSISLKHLTPNFPIPNDSVLNFTVAAYATENHDVDIRNISAVTHVYKLIIRDMNVNAGSNPNYCFAGACYGYGGSPTSYSCANTLTLNPGQSAASFTPLPFNLKADFDEGPVAGYTFVKYVIYDVANPSDSARVYLRYNPTLSGIKTNADVLESVSNIFPNPTSLNTNVAVTLKGEADVKIQVYNSLGALIYNAPIQKFTPGKHNIPINCSDFNSGLYFVSVLAGDSKITKRLIVNK